MNRSCANHATLCGGSQSRWTRSLIIAQIDSAAVNKSLKSLFQAVYSVPIQRPIGRLNQPVRKRLSIPGNRRTPAIHSLFDVYSPEGVIMRQSSWKFLVIILALSAALHAQT